MTPAEPPPAGPPASPLRFFVLVFLLTVPFLVVDAVSDGQIVPGVPLAGFAFVCPALAAVIRVHHERGAAGVRALLRRCVDARRVRAVWYLPVLLLFPAVVALSYGWLRLRGVDLPAPDIALGPTLLLALGFLVGALCEELGWSGYALEPLQRRYGALAAALLIGAVWAVWHWVSLLDVGRSVSWIAWWSLLTVAARVVMVWLYDRAGPSVFAMALFHMTLNLAWQLFPVSGSHYDQPSVAVLMAAVAVAVAVGWGRRDHRPATPPTEVPQVAGARALPPGGAAAQAPRVPEQGPAPGRTDRGGAVDALVVVESVFGNTRLVADAVAAGLGTRMHTRVVEVTEDGAVAASEGVDLLVVGGPTHAFGMTRVSTRRSAAEQAGGGAVPAEMGLREWLAALPAVTDRRFAASFDTRADKPRLPGSAASAAARRLHRLGYQRVCHPESFRVSGTTGPLVDGELDRARAWGSALAQRVLARQAERSGR
jgi:membrane protease YdiL (CAAX protease family)